MKFFSKKWLTVALTVFLVAFTGCDNLSENSSNTPNVPEKKEMGFVIQLPSKTDRSLYWSQDDVTEYSLKLRKDGGLIDSAKGAPGESVRFIVSEEGEYTIDVYAYCKELLIAEGSSDASVRNGDGFVTVDVYLVPKAKGTALDIAIHWQTPEGQEEPYLNQNYEVVEFGAWPQSLAAENISVDEADSKVAGMFTYYKGSDGAWYVKATPEKTGESTYYKVEPIQWIVYHIEDETLFVTKDVIAACSFYDDLETRIINDRTIYPNDWYHSRVRAFLNGIEYNKCGTATDEFVDKGFLQTAFTEEETAKIKMFDSDKLFLLNEDIIRHHPLRPDCTDNYILANGGKECDILWLKPNDESDDGLIWDGNYDVCHLKVIKEGVGVVPAFYFEGNFENQNPNNEKEEFTVTFFDRGREISTQTVRKGECAVFTKPEPNYYFSDVIRCRFDFVGWKTSDNAIFDFSNPISSDTFLEAYYESVDLSNCFPVTAQITGFDEGARYIFAELYYDPKEVNPYFELPYDGRAFEFLVFDSENNNYTFNCNSEQRENKCFFDTSLSSLPEGNYKVCVFASFEGKKVIYTRNGERVFVSPEQIEYGDLPENCFCTITISDSDYLPDKIRIWGEVVEYNNDTKKIFGKVKNLTSDSLSNLNVGFIIFDSRNDSYLLNASFLEIDESGNSIFECNVGSLLSEGQYKVFLIVNNRILCNGTDNSITLERIQLGDLPENLFYTLTISDNQ